MNTQTLEGNKIENKTILPRKDKMINLPQENPNNPQPELPIIQNRQIINNNNNNNDNFLVIYFFIYLVTNISEFGISGFIFIIMNHKNYDFSILALFGIILQIWKIAYNLFYYLIHGKKLPEFRSSYLLEIVLYLGNLIAILGYYLAFSKKIEFTELYYFSIPLIILTLIRAISGYIAKSRFLPSPQVYFTQSIFYLLVSLKLGNHIGLSWTVVLLYWYIGAGFLLFIGFIFFVIFLIFLCKFLKKNNNNQNRGIFYVFFILFPIVCYFAISIFNVVHGLKLFFDKGKYFLLYGNGYFMLIGCLIIIGIICIIFVKFIHNINEIVNKNKAESISLTKFAKNMQLEMQPVSGNYFKKKRENNIDPKKAIIKLEDCLICYEKKGEILIKPCGHSGICNDCILKCLEKTNILCPICKNEIKEVLVLEFDEEKKEYMANGNINFKKS